MPRSSAEAEREYAEGELDAAQGRLPLEGTVLITVADRDKPAVLDVARRFADLGFGIKATEGTNAFLIENGIGSELCSKVSEKRPHIVDLITDGKIQLVVNTPRGKTSKEDDSYIRKSAIKYKIPYITTTSAARAATRGIRDRRNGAYKVKSLQDYHRGIR